MEKIDLLNSYDVLSIARRWARADAVALDLAQRLTSKEDVAAEATRLTGRVQLERRRETFWHWVGLLGVATMVPGVLVGALMAFGVKIPPQYIASLASREYLLVFILEIAFWVLVGSTFKDLGTAAREQAESQLALLEPIEGTGDFHPALRYINAGHPDVLAWCDIALRDRGVLHSFDIPVIRALHRVSRALPVEASVGPADAARHHLHETTPADSAPAA